MIRREDCERAIRSGLDFLKKSQLPSGEFVTLVARNEELSIDAQHDPSPFATAHIVSSLCKSRLPESQNLIRRAVEFLLSQRLPGGFWKFWTRDHPGFANTPPDLDDCSVVPMALQDAGVPFRQNTRLIASNQNAKGEFLTWMDLRIHRLWNPRHWGSAFLWLPPYRGKRSFFLSGQSRSDDVDAVVTANTIAWLASCQAIDTRDAGRRVVGAVMARQEEKSDRFYQSPHALYHAMARGAERGATVFQDAGELVADRLNEMPRRDGMIGRGALDTALAAIARQLFQPAGTILDSEISMILRTQQAQGSWPASAFYYGGFDRIRFWGSKELTTGFCMEALARFLHSNR